MYTYTHSSLPGDLIDVGPHEVEVVQYPLVSEFRVGLSAFRLDEAPEPGPERLVPDFEHLHSLAS